MDIVIIGAGGHGRDCHQLLDDLHADGSARDLNLIGYVDDNPALTGQAVQGLPVLGGLDWLSGRSVAAVMGIGYPKPRFAVQQRASELGVTQWPTLVHPRAYVAGRARLGQGICLGSLASVGANVCIGNWAMINANAAVGHDAEIGQHVLLAGASVVGGEAVLGHGVLLGCGAGVRPQTQIGAWTTVGMGAMVTKDIPAGVTAVGSPARWKTLALA